MAPGAGRKFAVELCPCEVPPVTPSLMDVNASHETVVVLLVTTRCAHQMPKLAEAAPDAFTRSPATAASDSVVLSTDVGSPVYQPARAGMVVAAAEAGVAFQLVPVKFGSPLVFVEA